VKDSRLQHNRAPEPLHHGQSGHGIQGRLNCGGVIGAGDADRLAPGNFRRPDATTFVASEGEIRQSITAWSEAIGEFPGFSGGDPRRLDGRRILADDNAGDEAGEPGDASEAREG